MEEEDGRGCTLYERARVCWDIDEGINENGNVEGGLMEKHRFISNERWMGLRVLLRCRPSSSPLAVAVRVTRSRLFEEHTRDVKLNCETKLFAFIYATYVGRSCAKEEAAKFRVANNFSVRGWGGGKVGRNRDRKSVTFSRFDRRDDFERRSDFSREDFFFLGIKMIKSS